MNESSGGYVAQSSGGIGTRDRVPPGDFGGGREELRRLLGPGDTTIPGYSGAYDDRPELGGGLPVGEERYGERLGQGTFQDTLGAASWNQQSIGALHEVEMGTATQTKCCEGDGGMKRNVSSNTVTKVPVAS